MKKIRVVELFAGVGGFRLGLEKAGNKTIKYEISWSNQWEPSTTKQHASDIYISRFGNKKHSCEDIRFVVNNKFKNIPHHDLLVGGFPCQDYSVARALSQSGGLAGKKGVLWWSIYDILAKKGKNAPKFLFLENVDRLLKSPAKQRGRDFAIMLSSLASLGYAVEWRVINAADYGFPQRRRRIYILGYKKNSSIWRKIKKSDKKNWMSKEGVIAKAFKIKKENIEMNEFEVGFDPVYVSNKFSKDRPVKSPFENAGVMIEGKVFTAKTVASYKGKYSILRDFIIDEESVPEEYFIKESNLKRWEYLKGGKKEQRTSKDGYKYYYTEGGMVFPDSLDKPSRTIVTGEGGISPSRFKHVIKTKSGRLRRLTPIELERLNMFPDNHTFGVPDNTRAFIMGNALVVGVIKEIGKHLRKFL
jgi:DNA (cytosine-5)-methyltransferase 1